MRHWPPPSPLSSAITTPSTRLSALLLAVRSTTVVVSRVVVAGMVFAGIVAMSMLFAGTADAGGVAPTEQPDSAAGRAVFIAITLVVIVAAVILSLKYRKR